MNSIEDIDLIFFVKEEKIADKGEDSFCFDNVSKNGAAMISVFDGCGGAGARKYSVFGDRTGAYISSRVVSGVVWDWFRNDFCLNQKKQWNKQLKERIIRALKSYQNCCTEKSLIKGTLRKEFPTTMVTGLITKNKKKSEVTFLWAGDSRGYILDEYGMHQITIDDVDSKDAMINIKDDGVLRNVISLSKDFEINVVNKAVNKNSIIICATDGCFGYLESPIHFEFMVIDALIHSNSPFEWREKIKSFLSGISGDDYTMVAALYGFGDFDSVKKSFCKRKDYLEKVFINKWSEFDSDSQKMLWEKYRKEL